MANRITVLAEKSAVETDRAWQQQARAFIYKMVAAWVQPWMDFR